MQISPCQQDGVEKMVEWAAREGWNPGIHDAETFYRCDPQGYWLVEVDGQPVASVSGVSWNPHFAFLGLYIVTPDQRGQGLGLKLSLHLLEQHKGKLLGLDGVVAQQSNYAKLGFHLAHRSLRFAGTVAQISGGSGPFVAVSQVDPAEITRLDNRVSPSDRPAYLRAWLSQPDCRSLASPDGSALVVARPCRQGWKIGPLIAPDAATARDLLASVCAGLPPETPIFVDVPEPNQAGCQLLEKMGFTVSFEVARMYNQPQVPPHRLDWLFGITSFELG